MTQNFSLEYFFFDLPLYTIVCITDENIDTFQILCNAASHNVRMDGYNPHIKEITTFRALDNTTTEFDKNGGITTIRLKCMRSEKTLSFFMYYDVKSKNFMKVGQYPSVADFHISELKKYKKVISNDKLKEISKAIGLAANGVGVGSFVYLRRVFEYLINDAKLTSIDNGDLTEIEFNKLRMDEKIQVLKNYLPQFLVENKQLYSILSVGIHALEENQCLSHFDVVKIGIELILDEKLETVLKKEKMEAAKLRISQSHAQLTNKK